ncbi:hypothetical protein PROFUN_03413 [Planoprotostelium fungivorum]|uniref:Uncharacterized protein n=1 Tax=Planoprotostelium fungivorum TaxID=1890364 RepID=A0A2P6NWG3_9EUKA|nr:hypothetical protein PROFUN_03413 [Planoprotostelium fungivorum]
MGGTPNHVTSDSLMHIYGHRSSGQLSHSNVVLRNQTVLITRSLVDEPSHIVQICKRCNEETWMGGAERPVTEGFTQFEAPANHFLLGTQSSNPKLYSHNNDGTSYRGSRLRYKSRRLNIPLHKNSFNTSDQEHMGLRPLWHLIGIPSEADLFTCPTD